MKIRPSDLEYGAVLHQIVMHPVFTAINKITHKAGLYLINKTKHLLIKCSKDPGPEWSFTFTQEDVEIISNAAAHVALNCGGQTVCLLDETQLFSLLDSGSTMIQSIKVCFSDNESMRVSGPRGNLSRTVPHNAFPSEIFGRILPTQEEYAWPELGQLKFYHAPPEVMFTSTYRLLDLSDNLGARMDGGTMTVYMGISSISHKWPIWNEERLRQIENQTKNDLNFDGYKVKVQRHTPAVDPVTRKKDRPCSDEFVWKLTITD